MTESITTRANPQDAGISFWRRTPNELYLMACLGLVLTALLQFHPWLSIEQDLGPKKSINGSLYLVNRGYLPALNLSIACEFTTPNGSLHRSERVGGNREFAERLDFMHKQSLPCPNGTLPLKGITVFTVVVDYRVAWLPLHRCQTFNMKLAATADGTYRWLYDN
jgi:hypothetical protein